MKPLLATLQAFVAASLYFGLGLVVERAGDWTWVVLLFAALFLALCSMSYIEGTSLHQERGGATVLARYAFDELTSFVAGWALLLEYAILLGICAFVATQYAGGLWSPLGEGVGEVLLTIVLLGTVALGAWKGWFTPERFSLAVLATWADLALQVLLVVLGLALLLEPELLPGINGLTPPGERPPLDDALFAFVLAAVAFTGVDAASAFAGQVRISRRGLKQLVGWRLAATTVPYVGLGLVAASVLRGGEDAPLLSVARAFEQPVLHAVLPPLVVVSALAVLGLCAAAVLLGLSRVGSSLAVNRQIPSAVGRLHPEHRTPVVVIAIGSAIALGLALSRDLDFLGGIFAFGGMLVLMLVHLSVIVLRVREPDLRRPFRVPLSLPVRGYAIPVPSVVGFVVAGAAWTSVLLTHPTAVVVGGTWMVAGLVLYVIYRVSADKPLLGRVLIGEEALTRRAGAHIDYARILVPLTGTPIDDDIVQTAGRLAGLDAEERGAGVAQAEIEALWVFEVPVSRRLDGPLAPSEVEQANAALERAKAIGEEYADVFVATSVVRHRSAGRAIVEAASRDGVEAIVLAAERPSEIKGGPLLGGRGGSADAVCGGTTAYVVRHAPTRVILTAPPSHDPGHINLEDRPGGGPAGAVAAAGAPAPDRAAPAG